MSDTRIFCSRKQIEEGVFTVYGEEAHHALRVKRHTSGDTLRIFTEQGSEFICTIIDASKKRFRARIDEKLSDVVESPLELNIIQGMPKAAKLEQVIVHGTELGLSALYPVYTRHSVAKGERNERWRKLALEAVKQSCRRRIPAIRPAIPVEELDLEQFSDGLCVIAAEPPWSGSLKTALVSQKPVSKVTIVIGPEGGFAEEEYSRFVDAGFHPVSLGPRVLRTQTAPLALLAVLQWHLGDWEAGEEEA